MSRIPKKLTAPAGLAVVCVVTLVLWEIQGVVNGTTVGLVYLITIIVVARMWGTVASVLSSMLAALFFSFFSEQPVGFAIVDPEDWVAIVAFIVAAVIAGELSDRAHRRAVEARARQLEVEKLYALSHSIISIMLTHGDDAIGARLAKELATICAIPSVAIYDRSTDAVYFGGETPEAMSEAGLRETAITARPSTDERTGVLFAPISLGGQTIGSIVIQGGELSKPALNALLNLLAITLESTRTQEIATRAQAARQSEQFKSTILDGLAHEFKTPLTSIRAATTALLGATVSDTVHQSELLTIVDQEADRLNRLVTEVTRVARVEAGHIDLNREWHLPDDLINKSLLESELRRDGRHINVSVPVGLPRVFADADLITLALRQLIDNALKYSPGRSPIRIAAGVTGQNLTISVHNEGEPLSESEQGRVFEKFYRGQKARRQIAGTGIGLSIARDILRAHGGDVCLTGSDQHGTEFVLSIPVAAPQGKFGDSFSGRNEVFRIDVGH
jgi:two-component system sensor histidine kinase KdpD